MNSPVEHTDVGAYSLGLLDGRDRAAFEAHLAGCPRCQTELDELRSVRGLFDGLDRSVFSPLQEPPFLLRAAPTATLPVATTQGRGSRRRPRAARVFAAAAASAVLLVGGMAAGGAFTGSDTPHGLLAGKRYPTSGYTRGAGLATAAATLAPEGWGSRVTLELRGVRGPLRCFLVAVDKSGNREVIGNWTVPPKGYGLPSNPEPLVFRAGTSFPMDSLARLDVNVVGGQQVVTIPV